MDYGRDALTIDRGLARQDVFLVSELFRILHALYDQFGYGWFALANNVEKLGDGSEQPGLGMTIMQGCGDVASAQAASQLGVILEARHLLQANGARRGIMWRLCCELPDTVDELRMTLS